MARTVNVPEQLAPIFEAAEEAVSAFFASRIESPERGQIEIGGERYILVRASSLSVDFHDAMRALYDQHGAQAAGVVVDLLFHLAHDLGKTDAAAMYRTLRSEDPLARLSVGPAHFARAGWASVHIHPESNPTPDESCVFIYDHPYSFESDSWLRAGRRADRPICAMSAGYSSGWASEAYGIELVATELLCAARGDGRCHFVMAPPHRIEAVVAQYLGDHPEVAERVGAIAPPRRVDTVELTTRLAASEARYRQLFESSIDAILVVDAGRILRVNRSGQELLGRSVEELVGLEVVALAPTYQADGRPSREVFAERTASALEGAPQNLAWRLARPGGEVVETELTICRIEDQSDALEVIVRDVTERARAVAERQRLEQELRQLQKMEALGTLAGGVAHDFNNLLTAITGNLDLLERKVELGAARSYLDGARMALDRSEGIVRKLLTFARASQELEVVIDLRSLVEDNMIIFRETIDRRITVRTRAVGSATQVRGDPNYLAQVLMNLVLNARDALMADLDARDGAFIDVEVRAARRAPPDGELRDVVGVVVRDNGRGMDAETVSRVFEPFFTTKGAGSGLGMSTVYGIVHQHGGWLEIDSAPGRGTEVVAWLPRVDAVVTPAPPAPRPRPTSRPLTVLVVEDEPSLRKMVKTMLSDRGHRVKLAADGLEGVRIYEHEQGKIDVVLLDLTMPGLSGRGVLERIRALEPQQPVVIMSGFSADGRAGELIERGARAFLAKPFGAIDLIRIVEEVAS